MAYYIKRSDMLHQGAKAKRPTYLKEENILISDKYDLTKRKSCKRLPCNFSQNDKHTRPFFNIFLKNYLSPSLSFSLKHSGRFYYTENKEIKSIKQKV